MCIILDANMQGLFMKPGDADMKPVRDWLDKGGKIAYSDTADFNSEIQGRFRKRLIDLRKAGSAKQFDRKEVEAEQKKLKNLKSNDSHIIALAQVAKVKVLLSGDADLHEDFKTLITGGKIYKYAKHHKHLLRKDTCP